MNRYQFESRSSDAPPALVWGFVKIDALRAAAASVRCAAQSDDVAVVTLIGAGGEAAANGSVVHIEMYRLPGAEGAFAEGLKAIAAMKSVSSLPDGRAFDAPMLAPVHVPAHWRHKALHVVSDRRSIVHAYRGNSRAMIVRYDNRRGDLLRDDLFVWAMNNLSVINGAWLLDPPIAEQDSSADASESETYDVAGEPEEADAAGGTVRDRPLSEAEQQQVMDNAGVAALRLKVEASRSGREILDAIYNEVERLRPKFGKLTYDQRYSHTIYLGHLWGYVLESGLHWEWCWLTPKDGGEEHLAIVSPDRAYCVSPVDFMIYLLMQEGPEADNTVVLLFNMILAKKLPPARPWTYLMLS